MVTSEARVATPNAAKYMVQLCKHFRHKVTVEYDDQQARVDFPFGVCRMTADAEELVIRCEANSEDLARRMEVVLDQHLQKFAWREKPAVDWRIT